MRRRGFSLLELLMILALLGMMLAMAAFQWRRPGTSQQSRALGETLLARLHQTRQRAMASGSPVGLALARQGQVAYWLEGEPARQRTGTFPWSGELPQGLCFFGEWPLDSGTWTADPDSATVTHPNDALLVFSPAGQVRSNLRLHQDSFWLVSCSAYSAASGNLQSVTDPWSLQIRKTGLISLWQGLASGSAVSQPALPGLMGPSAPLPPLAGNHPPVLDLVSAEPEPVAGSLPAGVDAAVRPDGYLSFRVEARDPDDEVLRCHWQTDSGRFSAVQEARMEWEPERQKWVSHWTFSPPTNAQPGEVYTLQCRVRDPRGNQVSGTFPVGGRVLISRRPRLCFASDVDSGDPTRRGLYLSNLDGMERRLLFDGRGTLDCPRWSPDGSRILFLYDPGAGINLDLWIARADGSGRKKLIDASSQGWLLVAGAAFTPDGTKIVVDGFRTGSHDLVWIDVDGNRPSNPAQPGFDVIRSGIAGESSFTGLDIHPGSGHILQAYRNGELHLFRSDGSEIPVTQPALPGGISETQASFSPDGNTLYLNHFYRTLHSAPFTLSASAATVGATTFLGGDAAAPLQGPHVSPDGLYLFYNRQVGSLLQVWKRDLTTGQEFLLTPPGVCDDDVWCSQ